MSGFFKAWAAYSGILVKLAPQALQGELDSLIHLYYESIRSLGKVHMGWSQGVLFSVSQVKSCLRKGYILHKRVATY